MKTQELIKIQELNIDLLDANRNLTSYLIDVYEKNGITHEEFSHAKSLLRQAGKALAYLNGKPNQPTILDTKKTDEDFTEPKNRFCQIHSS